MVKAILACVLFSLQLAFCEYEFTGNVVSVADGDTISVLRGGRKEAVRLSGIDCPEKGQAYGSEATKITTALAMGKTVTVQAEGKDRYGRWTGKVFLPNGQILNRQLVYNGYAWWYRKYAKKDTDLESLEGQARAARRGLWADPNPVPPWDYRDRKEGESQPPSPTHTPTTPDYTPPVSSPSQTTSPVAEGIVYITPEGNAYHRAYCRFVKKGGSAISLAEAKRSRLPCKVCKP